MKAFKELKQSVKEKIKPTNTAGISSGDAQPNEWLKDLMGIWAASSMNQGIRDSFASLNLQKNISKYVDAQLSGMAAYCI